MVHWNCTFFIGICKRQIPPKDCKHHHLSFVRIRAAAVRARNTYYGYCLQMCNTTSGEPIQKSVETTRLLYFLFFMLLLSLSNRTLMAMLLHNVVRKIQACSTTAFYDLLNSCIFSLYFPCFSFCRIFFLDHFWMAF